MSRLDELMQELCPDGVSERILNDVFEQFSGMTGVSNKWSDKGNCEFIDYMNAYSNLKIDVSAINFATVSKLKQNVLTKGDILFTSASETPDECAIASEIEDDIKHGVFLDDHLFGLRVKKDYKNYIASGYLKYAFRTQTFRAQVNKVVRGVTRFYISKTDFMKLSIPLPPLPVQREIVRILDSFTELTAELTARKKQYEYYLESLIITGDKKHKVKLSEVCEIYDGTHQTPTYTNSGIRFVSVENIDNLYASTKYISIEAFEKYRIKPQIGDVLMTRITAGIIGKCTIIDRDEPLAYYVSLALLRPKNDVLNSKYLKYYIESGYGKKELRKYILTDANPPKINKDAIGKVMILLPSIEEQKKIVSVIEKFDALCSDITTGLPAEIEARKKQYEYYRDKFLTFPEAKA